MFGKRILFLSKNIVCLCVYADLIHGWQGLPEAWPVTLSQWHSQSLQAAHAGVHRIRSRQTTSLSPGKATLLLIVTDLKPFARPAWHCLKLLFNRGFVLWQIWKGNEESIQYFNWMLLHVLIAISNKRPSLYLCKMYVAQNTHFILLQAKNYGFVFK